MKNHAWYALRRTLPPWRFEECFAELMTKLPEYRIDELIVKVDTEEFSHGHPDVAWLEGYRDKLMRVKTAMAELNILFSINPWITLGHCDRGRNDLKRFPGLQTIVGHDGQRCLHCACPLSTVWRDNIEKLWTIYAELKPHVIWVEDDIRTFNHRPVTFGCFCPEHMSRFSRIAGQTVAREELVAAMLAPGEPHPWRKMFMDMQSEIMTETVAFLSRVVHRVSPETHMGLMSSGGTTHALEGRDWHRFAAALADGNTLYSRPPLGNYCEISLRGLYRSFDSIRKTRYLLPTGCIEQTELENVPFTLYSKSVAFSFATMALSFACGTHGVTMNIFDHAGTLMDSEPWYGRMLADRKNYLNSLALASRKQGVFRGVRLLFDPRTSSLRRLNPNAAYEELAGDGDPLTHALEAAGIATTYETPCDDADSAAPAVFASMGQMLRGYADEQLLGMLRQGMLLDAEAAGVVYERGFGEYIGLKSRPEAKEREEYRALLCGEEYFNPDFGGEPFRIMTCSLPSLTANGRFAKLEPVDGTAIISRIIDQDAQPVMPGMIAFENALGGRVVIHALEYSSAIGIAFHHPFRTMQLQNVIRFLSDNKPELLFNADGAFPLTYRRDCGDYSLIGAFNLTLDEWTRADFAMQFRRRPDKIERLAENGEWINCSDISSRYENGMLSVKCVSRIDYKLPLILKIS